MKVSTTLIVSHAFMPRKSICDVYSLLK